MTIVIHNNNKLAYYYH